MPVASLMSTRLSEQVTASPMALWRSTGRTRQFTDGYWQCFVLWVLSKECPHPFPITATAAQTHPLTQPAHTPAYRHTRAYTHRIRHVVFSLETTGPARAAAAGLRLQRGAGVCAEEQ